MARCRNFRASCAITDERSRTDEINFCLLDRYCGRNILSKVTTVRKARSFRNRIAERMKTLLHVVPVGEHDTAQPEILHSELFSVEQMERHGKILADHHAISRERSPDVLLERLSKNENILVNTCLVLGAKASESNRVTPAAEWLLDNFYLIEEQIRTTKRHLPKQYGRGLPKLSGGESKGLPRVYDIALHLIAHGDGRWDSENLSRFISAYQTYTPLTLGELWAVPIMLRLALIENLAKVSARLAVSREHHDLADTWADRMEGTAKEDPKSLILVIADMARSNPPLSSAFVAELVRRLQGQGAALALPLTWVEQRLSESGLTLVRQVQVENQLQATNQTTVSNCIASLRRLGEMDWREFVEQRSVVEEILKQDPAGLYGYMDFSTRDQYRHVVEKLAQASPYSEKEVAEAAIRLAEGKLPGSEVEQGASAQFTASAEYPDMRHAHVGYYLVGTGACQLARVVLERPCLKQRLHGIRQSTAVRLYVGAIILLTLVLSTYLLLQSYYAIRVRALAIGDAAVDATLWLLAPISIVLLLASSHLVLSLSNWIIMLLAKPQPLPRMDFSKGLPDHCRTLVVIPSMLGSQKDLDALVEALEVRFLGNRDTALHFSLLTDFNDADNESLTADQELLDAAKERFEALNRRYASADGGDIFFLFHRPRQWSPGERKWIGYERKRGKLSALNALLLSSPEALPAAIARFSLIVGDVGALLGRTASNSGGGARVKYIITLDADTQLPRESARQFVATMAHPLNRPRYDHARKCVVEGHGILQPRVAEALPIPKPTRYARLLGSEPGIDPYTRSVSDVYQDMFDEGSFIGKGIYDVDIFEKVLAHRFPENSVLSHDLLEGCYLRSGLITDIPLYEQSPGSYIADARRRARWIRGDWQLLGWLLPHVANESGCQTASSLSVLSQWKLFDNLRRSLVPAALMVLLGFGWLGMASPALWTGAVFAVIALPAVIASLYELALKPDDVLTSQHLRVTLHNAGRRAAQIVTQISALPHEAAYSLGAAARTLFRMFISKRNLLQWTPSDQAGRQFSGTPYGWLRALWVGPFSAVAYASAITVWRPDALLLGAPFLLLWLFSPVLLAWLSKPTQPEAVKLPAGQVRFLHLTARKTWEYFAHFVTAEDHWLPPDNYQEAPKEGGAHRTSPTNIGMALLANLSAYDFGYLSMGQLLARTQATFETLRVLERYRGHFYNWYDTRTLEVLPPHYVSTVDSGNLAGHLIVLRQGLLELLDAPLAQTKGVKGLIDTLDVLTKVIGHTPAALAKVRTMLEMASAEFASPAAAAVFLSSVQEAIETALGENAPTGETTSADWWGKLLEQCRALHEDLDQFADIAGTPDMTLRKLAACAAAANGFAAFGAVTRRVTLIEALAAEVDTLTEQDYDFLYEPASRQLTVGFNAESQRRDRGTYDLLSSEARLGIYIAIAQGKLPQDSWFALGRLLTLSHGAPVLVSWSGSMFEYLMPMLIMPTYDATLLDQTCRTAVVGQINYGRQRGTAWGISESGYYAVDAMLNYQYRAFGVPGLGLKRGLAEDLVIAPYASTMALMVEPAAACKNMQRLADEGACGRFGFYEVIDRTPARLPRGQDYALVRSFMAHHQGMSLLALAFLLHGQPMQRRFIADVKIQAALLLLQERIPNPVASYSQVTQASIVTAERVEAEDSFRVFEDPNTPMPEIQLLSNGRYHLMVTQAGGGYSRWRDFAVTRWRADGTCDNWGLFGYIKDVQSGEFWSTAYQPTTGRASNFKTVFSEAHVEFTRREKDIETRTEIGVSPEDDIELRRIRIRNHGKLRRTIEFTSYGEIVLAPQMADQAHPAFSNLFVETEILPQQHAVLATRRPRSKDEKPPWLCHMLIVHDDGLCITSYETDRARFIGRNRSVAAPAAMIEAGTLSNTDGAILDPIVAIRTRISLEAGASVSMDLITGISETRSHCLELIERYRDRRLANRVFGLAWTHNQVLLRQLNASEADTQLYSQLASSVIYNNPNLRAEPAVLTSNRRGQSGLWGYSISGDLPIVLLHIEDISNIGLVRQLLQAHAYWRQKGLAADLVILNGEGSTYRQPLQDTVASLMAAGASVNQTDGAGGIFVRATEHMPAEDKTLLYSVAAVVLSDKRGSLQEQLARRPAARTMPPLLLPVPIAIAEDSNKQRAFESLAHLHFFNDFGGFSADGKEYVIRLSPGEPTPAPWANVIANPTFGTVISESGQAYTWTENAHEMRLTPWKNDPVCDAGGELYYLRDEETGQFWSPTALPCRGRGDYFVQHGFGYSVFTHTESGIHSELTVYVARDVPIKFATLKITNESQRNRRLSATGYIEWVLGDLRDKSSAHLSTEANTYGAILARNAYNIEFGERTAFFHVTTSTLEPITRTITGDRTEFFGRNGSPYSPAALRRKRLSGRLGAGIDSCAAIQIGFQIQPQQTRELCFMLGVGKDQADANALIERFRGGIAAQDALAAIKLYWQHTLDAVRVHTPDEGLNLLANGWLLYQTLSSRLWARSGYYQSGGAFGFRDQLQDAMALVHTAPELLRMQILNCAARQFEEGDVQHWWHPPLGRGVRTRCSDDFLWLPFALCRYVETTGDVGILDEMLPFLQGRQLNRGEESYYDLPVIGGERTSVFNHAVRAIRHGLKFGVHGLPLMGSGDWNDGMNLVGEHGKGESVWLAFFLGTVLTKFSALALQYGDEGFAAHCDTEAQALRSNIDAGAWDGKWYRRAYFDDGTPLGTVTNTECRIDAIAQSWSVLSGMVSAPRARQAMDSLYHHLVYAEEGLVKLLEPPFDKGGLNPGYIKGYVPGVRENGGQYTHSAIWAAMAFARLLDNERAWQLFNIINPINHGRNKAEATTYRVEPYVVAADIYGIAPHTGRGGWSWYTGSAGWMYRLILESLLGLSLERRNNQPYLRISPCVPADWKFFSIDYRYLDTTYQISLNQTPGNQREHGIFLVNDGATHYECIDYA